MKFHCEIKRRASPAISNPPGSVYRHHGVNEQMFGAD
jgi:hypothetical protein